MKSLGRCVYSNDNKQSQEISEHSIKNVKAQSGGFDRFMFICQCEQKRHLHKQCQQTLMTK